MIALKLAEVRVFMNKLLCTETFDNFLLQEATIQGSISYHIEGTLHRDFYSEDELEQEHLGGLSFIPYGKVRTQCFDLIKGKRTPSFFKFVLLLSPSNLEKTLQHPVSHHCIWPDALVRVSRRGSQTGPVFSEHRRSGLHHPQYSVCGRFHHRRIRCDLLSDAHSGNPGPVLPLLYVFVHWLFLQLHHPVGIRRTAHAGGCHAKGRHSRGRIYRGAGHRHHHL